MFHVKELFCTAMYSQHQVAHVQQLFDARYEKCVQLTVNEAINKTELMRAMYIEHYTLVSSFSFDDSQVNSTKS